jgi:uncharacterized membrane-anchored protein
MNLEALGKGLVVLALVLLLAGGALIAAAKLGLPRLPGDLAFEGRHWKIYLPIATSILLSVIATIVLNLLARFWR